MKERKKVTAKSRGHHLKSTLGGSWTVGGRQRDVWERLVELLGSVLDECRECDGVNV